MKKRREERRGETNSRKPDDRETVKNRKSIIVGLSNTSHTDTASHCSVTSLTLISTVQARCEAGWSGFSLAYNFSLPVSRSQGTPCSNEGE